MPVIASRCGGPEEIIRHEENGLLFEPGDADGLAACMRRCLDEPDLLESLRGNANARGIRALSDQVEQILDTYQAIIETAHREGLDAGSSGRHQQIDERLDVIAVRRTVAIDVRQAEGGVLVAE